MKKTLSVSGIKQGTVIDHIPQGQALKIIQLLELSKQEYLVCVGLNLPSTTMGLKDLIKIENRFLTEKESQDIAVFAPEATINIIRNYKVEKKIKAVLPQEVVSLLECLNPRCVTRHEPISSSFFVEEFKNLIYLRCKYCEKVFERDKVK
jgi:aspartate carbamoyltransferase regulatory subunit